LRELFAALDDDPRLVAECLVRPLLTDRLLRNRYARDSRFHDAVRDEAEAALALHANDPAAIQTLGGDYTETVWRRVEDEQQRAELEAQSRRHRVLALGAEQWRDAVARLALSHAVDLRLDDVGDDPGGLLRRIPTGTLSVLQEENDRFLATAVLSIGSDRLRIAALAWAKRSVADWWDEEGRHETESSPGTQAVAAPAAGYRLPQLREGGCTADTWTELWYAPRARIGHTVVWTGSEMIVWGGCDNYVTLNTGGRYDPATDTWIPTSRSAGAASPRWNQTAVWTGTEMIVWGGESDVAVLNTGGRYDPVANGWSATSVAGEVPSPRQNHAAVWTGAEMIVWGGEAGATDLNTGGRYDPVADAWTETSTRVGVPSPRSGPTAVWTGAEMIVWGGTQVITPLRTGGRYDPATDGWTPTSSGPGVPSAREDHTAIWTGDEMIVWGGKTGSLKQKTGGRFDPAADAWTATSTGAGVPSPRDRHSAVWTGTEMIVWGGIGDDSQAYTHSGGRYDPLTDSWSATSTEAPVPVGRADHQAVWTGSEMVVWGGISLTNYEETGGRYDPATDSWVATALGAEVPIRRYDHTAIWTGSEMIVWGGWRRYGPLDSGGRYDPATDSWTATSIGVGLPEARQGHSAVWTGTEMIVWGGARYGQRLGSSGRYAPATDSWAEVPPGVGLEQGRLGQTAVWTGAEMIVWGGEVASRVTANTGARYDPPNNRWSATSTTYGVPRRREEHSAVWTGEELIVWGGRDYPGAGEASGGRYDPSTDLWSETSEGTGVPDPRYQHLAVWTGREMIVWGGTNFPTSLNDGGRYDPRTDSWTATSTGAGVPPPGFSAAAVWTGEEMIVWGTDLDGTGGRYDPWTDSWTATSTSTGMPPGRRDPTAVWTGTQAIFWGGTRHVPLNGGGLYCACEGETVSVWYPDADGDGLGVDTTGVPFCEQPGGHVAAFGDCDDRYASCTSVCTDADADGMPACAPDCDDTNPYCTTDCTDADLDGYCVTHDCDERNADTHPGAEEVNDGLDNQCPGDPGHSVIDEISGVCGFLDPANLDAFSWPAQAGATGYEVARSPRSRLDSQCVVLQTSATAWIDTEPVPAGVCFHYLVRATQPHLGSWGTYGSGNERIGVCP
jgi:N-acetylneuraminic acid mutarotase